MSTEIKEEEVVNETIEPTEDTSSHIEDSEVNFFAGSEQPREYFEEADEEGEEDEQGTEAPEEPESIKFSDTNEEDVEYFKMAMEFLDNSRAMGFSFMVDKSMDHVDKYTFYKNWNDPKHAATLRAGAVIAKKYKFSAFDKLPELMLAISIVISTAALYKLAKEQKLELEKQKSQTTREQYQKTKEVKLKPFKAAK